MTKYELTNKLNICLLYRELNSMSKRQIFCCTTLFWKIVEAYYVFWSPYYTRNFHIFNLDERTRIIWFVSKLFFFLTLSLSTIRCLNIKFLLLWHITLSLAHTKHSLGWRRGGKWKFTDDGRKKNLWTDFLGFRVNRLRLYYYDGNRLSNPITRNAPKLIVGATNLRVDKEEISNKINLWIFG